MTHGDVYNSSGIEYFFDAPFVSFLPIKYSVCVHWYIDTFLSMSMRVIHCALTSFDGNNCSTIEHGLV